MTELDTATNATGPMLQVTDLVKHFTVKSNQGIRSVKRTVQAVSGVSFSVDAGQTLGLVGESGCGKTTVGRSVLRLVEPTGGTVRFAGQDVRATHGAALRALRRRMQVVFQDPYGSLNPRMTVRSILEEGLVIHRLGAPAARLERMTRAKSMDSNSKLS